jgi:hypothetical protein
LLKKVVVFGAAFIAIGLIAKNLGHNEPLLKN